MRVPNNSIGQSNTQRGLQLHWFLQCSSPTALQEPVCVPQPHLAPPAGLIQPENRSCSTLSPIVLTWITSFVVVVVSPFSFGLQHSPFLTVCIEIFYSALPNVMQLDLKTLYCPHLLAFPVFASSLAEGYSLYHIIQIFHWSFHCFW